MRLSKHITDGYTWPNKYNRDARYLLGLGVKVGHLYTIAGLYNLGGPIFKQYNILFMSNTSKDNLTICWHCGEEYDWVKNKALCPVCKSHEGDNPEYDDVEEDKDTEDDEHEDEDEADIEYMYDDMDDDTDNFNDPEDENNEMLNDLPF